MKRIAVIFLMCCVVPFLFIGCARQNQTQDQGSPVVGFGNPWSEWNSIEEAELATGFSFGLPNVIGDCCAAEFRTMNNEMIEIIYKDQDEGYEVCIRKQKGEGQDISGDYNEYEICSEKEYYGGSIAVYSNSGNDAMKVIIGYRGYSWSIVTTDGLSSDSLEDFLSSISK